jgi:hypothetical protein
LEDLCRRDFPCEGEEIVRSTEVTDEESDHEEGELNRLADRAGWVLD